MITDWIGFAGAAIVLSACALALFTPRIKREARRYRQQRRREAGVVRWLRS